MEPGDVTLGRGQHRLMDAFLRNRCPLSPFKENLVQVSDPTFCRCTHHTWVWHTWGVDLYPRRTGECEEVCRSGAAGQSLQRPILMFTIVQAPSRGACDLAIWDQPLAISGLKPTVPVLELSPGSAIRSVVCTWPQCGSTQSFVTPGEWMQSIPQCVARRQLIHPAAVNPSRPSGFCRVDLGCAPGVWNVAGSQ